MAASRALSQAGSIAIAQSDDLPTILCPLCGTPTLSLNDSNMCTNCLKTQVDITEGLSKQVTIFYCKGCGRYLGAQKWAAVALESRELLALCLKKIKGLNKAVKLIDASFIWTEPHSRRIKIKLTVQKEMFHVVLQQSCIIEFIVAYQQCVDCQKSFTEHTWNTVIQVRQKVKHKRTFFWLEQLLIKHSITGKVQNIKEQPDGLDFYWTQRNHAAVLMNFLPQVAPIRKTTVSKRLISADVHSNTANFKFSYLIEIAPICRDDLVILPPKVSGPLGGAGPLLLCTKVSSQLHFVDTTTLQAVELPAGIYWRNPFNPILNSRNLVEYVVLDIDKAADSAVNPHSAAGAAAGTAAGPSAGAFQLAECSVAKVADFGSNDTQYRTMTHLGHLLAPGDHVLGYDTSTANITDVNTKFLKGKELPECVLVRKTFPDRRNRAKYRKWKLKRLRVEAEEAASRKAGNEKDEDYEQFMRDIEEDPDMQTQINIYKRERAGSITSVGTEEKVEDGFPDVPLDLMLDAMAIHAEPEAAAAPAGAEDGDEDGEAAEDAAMEDDPDAL